jgi:hypothetical protein
MTDGAALEARDTPVPLNQLPEALYRTRTDDPFLTMEGPGVSRCDPVLPDGHQRPAAEGDSVAQEVGRTSITEQPNGRVMDAQSRLPLAAALAACSPRPRRGAPRGCVVKQVAAVRRAAEDPPHSAAVADVGRHDPGDRLAGRAGDEGDAATVR